MRRASSAPGASRLGRKNGCAANASTNEASALEQALAEQLGVDLIGEQRAADMTTFGEIRDAALVNSESLVRTWFPRGRRIGREWKIGNLRGDPGESLSINLETGKWSDFATSDSGYDLIELRAAMTDSDRMDAAREIAKHLGLLNGRPHLNGHDRPQEKPAPTKGGWHSMVPPPQGTPEPPRAMLGGFDQLYEYRDADGKILLYVGRLEAKNGRQKSFVPLTFGELDGNRGWHKKAAAAPRPLYRLDSLAARPNAEVVICEGEKAADAAQDLFPDRVCMTWPGGSNAVQYADFSPLSERTVIIWPDNDKAGLKAADEIAKRLPGARILRVDDMRAGGDAADVIPDNPDEWLAEHLPRNEGVALRDYLTIETWTKRDIPEPDRLLGDLITTTTRMFLVGRTGLGKTLLGLAMALGMASGRGFLHWRSTRPARVLYLDGEMPADLIKARAIDGLRRLGGVVAPGNLMIFGRDLEDGVAERFPILGKMPPLNTEEGRSWLFALIHALGGVDVIIFDNVMSLLLGRQKDEEAWNDTLALVQALTRHRIGQIWLDHTGHDASRQYGSSTKSWRFDTVGVMRPLSDDQRRPGEVAFTLSFEPPGKARRRTPENWQDFETVTIRLADDRWTSEAATQTEPKGQGKVPPSRRLFHDALVAAVTKSPAGPNCTTLEAWEQECLRLSLIEGRGAECTKETSSKRAVRRRDFRRAKASLLAAGWIAVTDEVVTDLRRHSS